MSKARPSLSVALATFNGAQWLPAQLDSLIAQSAPPDELVVVDDASADGTWELLQAFAQAAPFPVRLMRNPTNLGSTRSFDRAIGRCGGELIALCDQDDLWHQHKLEVLGDALRADPRLGGAFSDALMVSADLAPLPGTLWERIKLRTGLRRRLADGRVMEVLARGNAVTGCTLAFRSGFRDRILPIPAGSVHDAWIAWMVGATHPGATHPLLPIERPLVSYRQHGANQIGVPAKGALGQQIGGRQQARTDLFRALAEESRAVALRLDALGLLTDDGAALLAGRARHVERRARLAGQGWRAVPGIAAELVVGGYGRYSDGLASAARDLLTDPGA